MEMAPVPQASAGAGRDLRFAQELTFSLSDLQYNYPDEPTESGLGPQAELERLAREGQPIVIRRGCLRP
ncbi:hypothetical protein [Mesorhizobium sophorae]|uniref:hypothetical protein n=1 Tax=Mesorhizobium sophorae TaxID=1300294 RepID=UPI003CC9A6D2